MPKLLLLLLLPVCLQAQPFTAAETGRWKAQAQNVTIHRDNWGIPHIYGKTDADAVFGLLYAQCEDDFKRVELNYIEKLGRMAEVKGDTALYDDLYIRLIIDSAEAVADYRKSPAWLKKLLNAYADGINYYLYTHPAERPLLLRRFQPWYPLLWTDGSIGAISTGTITEDDVKAFYGGGQPQSPAMALQERQFKKEMLGSNGFAIAPSRSASGNALLYINPHVTFYFRPEVHVASNEGLNVYGAVTWGQLFVYQGFNEHCGWMHTSSNVDVADMYAEKITQQNGRRTYLYNGKQLPVKEKKIVLRYQTANGPQTKTVTAYYTHHGPVMGQRNGQWVAVRGYNRSLTSLVQSWLRTKATGYASYRQTMQLRSNTSNNTVFADNKGHIAYWHGNHVPVRDTRYNWGQPVDGTTPATEWKGLHALDEIVQLHNPPNGWIQNCNSTPFTAAGSHSPKREDYPGYMAPDGENFRGLNAARVLARENSYTLDKLIAAGYNRTLSIFEVLVPALTKAFDNTVQPGTAQHALLQGPVQELRQWNYQCGNTSVATTLAIEWVQRLSPLLQKVYVDIGEHDQVQQAQQLAATAQPGALLGPLQQAVETLQRQFGKWQVPWGDLNRYQRISSDIDQRFNDAQPSQPVPFAASTWGMLPAYNSKYYPNSKLRYGVGGNSFVCAVEFGKKLKAKSLLAGGQSGHPASPHFSDQLLMYTEGRFKDVLFYKEDVEKNTVKKYHPGE
jgi:acyl-homoserine-lactone acylase